MERSTSESEYASNRTCGCPGKIPLNLKRTGISSVLCDGVDGVKMWRLGMSRPRIAGMIIHPKPDLSP